MMSEHYMGMGSLDFGKSAQLAQLSQPWWMGGNSITGDMSPSAMGMDWDQLGAYGKMGVIGQGVGAATSIMSLINGINQAKMQKKQFNFFKDMQNKNYANQVTAYDNALRDQHEGRAAYAAGEGKSYDTLPQYMAPRQMTGTIQPRYTA